MEKRIGKYRFFIAGQQCCHFNDAGYLRRRDGRVVHQNTPGTDVNLRFHAEVSLVAFLYLGQVGIVLVPGILRRGRRHVRRITTLLVRSPGSYCLQEAEITRADIVIR